MALRDVGGVNLVPGLIARAESAPVIVQSILDAGGELCGAVIQIPKTGNISKIGFRTVAVTVSDAIKVSLQTVDETTGRPTGTLIHADAYGIQASVSTNTTYWVSLQNPVAVTKSNTPIAIVVEFNSYVSGNLRIISAIRGFPSADIRFPYAFQFLGSAWTFLDDSPNLGLEYDDGEIKPMVLAFPAIATSTISWDTNNNPDRIGLRVSVPYNCRVSGIFALIDLDGDADIEIYDSDGITVSETISLDKDIRSSATNGVFFIYLVTPIELTKDTFYRVIVHPTTGTNIVIYYLDVTNDGAVEAMNAIDGGVNMHYTTCDGSPSAEGDWTQTATRRPLIGLMIDQLDDGYAPVEGLASISGVTILLSSLAKITSLLTENSTMGATLLEGASKIKTVLSKGSLI